MFMVDLSLLCGLQATSYLNKLPSSFSPEDRILVADPMLATGMLPYISQKMLPSSLRLDSSAVLQLLAVMKHYNRLCKPHLIFYYAVFGNL